MKKKILIVLFIVILGLGALVIWQYGKSASQKEMLNMYNNNQSITIEIAEPISQEQGTEVQFEWLELASLDTYTNFRMDVDDTLNITAHGNNGKNGVLYVDLEGNQTNNSTLMYAFMNQKFLDNVWNSSETMKSLLDTTKENYVDVESDAVAKVAFLNAYYNLYNDAEPNYFNGNQTLTRAEFMQGTYKACEPVSELEVNAELQSLVDSTGTDPSVPFASAMLEYSYLNTTDKSLNNNTYNGTISRAEAIYTLVKMFYNAEYEALTGKEAAYGDTKNGGDIASKIGLAVKNKETGEVTTKDYLKSYELSYSLMNPDKGMPTDLYNAMVVAKQHNLITGTESRWDEGLTKGEAINLLVKVFTSLTPITNADRGASVGEVVNTPELTTEQEIEIMNNELYGEVNDLETLNTEQAITQNEDGTYTFSEEFISSLSTFDYFEGASTEMMIDYLTKIAKTLKSTNEKDFQLALTQMGEDHRLIDVWGTPEEYSARKHPDQQPQQPQQSTPSTDTNTNNSSSSSTTNTNTNTTTNTTTGGNTTTTTQTPPESTEDTYEGDGTFQFDDDVQFGGGGQGEIPDGFTGIN